MQDIKTVTEWNSASFISSGDAGRKDHYFLAELSHLCYFTPNQAKRILDLWDDSLGYSLTLSLHSHGQTLHVSAVLTAISLAFVDHTVAFISTRISQVLSHSSLEKAFAPFTTGKRDKQ